MHERETSIDPVGITKICSKCRVEKNLLEFDKQLDKKTGVRSQCKLCRQQERILDKEKIGLQRKLSYSRNKERIINRTHVYYKNNKEEVLEKQRDYYLKNREEILVKKREYYYSHQEEDTRRSREYRKLNRDRLRPNDVARCIAYRTTKIQACPRWADLNKIKEIYKERERISKETGTVHHVDHVIPLRSKIVCGLHVPENLRIIPAIENLSKHNKLIEEIL